jgi:hypothetical protein
MFSTRDFQPAEEWGRCMFDAFGNWDTQSSFDRYNKCGEFSSAREALSYPPGRPRSPQSAPQRHPVADIRLDRSTDISDMMENVCLTEERWQPVQYVLPSQPSPSQHQPRNRSHQQISARGYQQSISSEPSRHCFLQTSTEESHAYQGIRNDSHQTTRHNFQRDTQQPHGVASRLQLQREARRQRQAITTRCPEQNAPPEPPPAYSFLDPTLPLLLPVPGLTLAERWAVQARPERTQIRNNSLSGVLGGAVEGVHGHMRAIPKAIKAAPARLRTRRARLKLKWLKKHNFLSEQERYLSSDLTG